MDYLFVLIFLPSTRQQPTVQAFLANVSSDVILPLPQQEDHQGLFERLNQRVVSFSSSTEVALEEPIKNFSMRSSPEVWSVSMYNRLLQNSREWARLLFRSLITPQFALQPKAGCQEMKCNKLVKHESLCASIAVSATMLPYIENHYFTNSLCWAGCSKILTTKIYHYYYCKSLWKPYWCLVD